MKKRLLSQRWLLIILLSGYWGTATMAQTTWTGTNSTSWTDPGNWSAGVPDATDDVTIPNPANKPVIGAGTAAVAKSVTITVAAAQLTISSNASLSINGSTGFALENFGILDNSGTIRIGNTSSVANRGIVHRNGGTLNNKTGGLIQIDRTSAVEAFFTSGIVNNEATIEIGSNAAVTGTGLTIVAGTGTFNNKANSLLTINRSTGFALENRGILDNSGTIKIGNITSVANRGIVHRNGGTLNNKTGGLIQIDRTSAAEAFYTTGLVNNEGSIQIGGNAAVVGYGIRIEGNIFNNKTGGTIEIGSTGAVTGSGVSYASGIYNRGTFVNDALITIDNDIRKAQDGIFNGASGSFTNSATGTISIKKTWGNGIWNYFGNFTNAGKITIKDIFNVEDNDYSTGILSYGSFSNQAGSEIHLDLVGGGIISTNTFTNAGIIRMGENAPLSAMGILNLQATGVFNNNTGGDISIKQTATHGVQNDVSSTFNNNACARLTVFDNVNNAGNFTNAGLLTVSTTQAQTNTGTLTNNGIIEYPQGSPIPNVTNNDLIVAPNSICVSTIPPALQIGGMNNFTVGTTWYSDKNLTVQAGTYNQATNTFTATNLPSSGTHTVYFSVSDASNPCPRTVSLKVPIYPNLFTVTGGGTSCNGSGININLSGSQVGVSYQLKRGNINVGNPKVGTGAPITFTQSAAGVYTVVAVVGCPSLTMNGSATVLVYKPNVDFTTSSGKYYLCPGTSLTLIAPNESDVSYEWLLNNFPLVPAAKSNTLIITKAGPYTLKAIGTGFCNASNSKQIYITAAVATSFSATNTLTASKLTLVANPSGLEYAWSGPSGFSSALRNPVIMSPNGSNAGIYTVNMLVPSTGCTGTATTKVVIGGGSRLAAEEMSEQIDMQINAYPNPVTHTLMVEVVLQKPSKLKLQLFNSIGKESGTWQLNEESIIHKTELNMSELQGGVYLLQAQVGKQKVVKRVVKIQY